MSKVCCATTTTTVGTSTNCSAIFVAARAARRGRDGQDILGTSITCSGTEMSMCLETSTSWSTLRLTCIEDLHHGSEVGKLLQGVPLSALLRPRPSESLGPLPIGLFLVQLERAPAEGRREGEGGEGGSPRTLPCSASRSSPLRSWPASVPVEQCGKHKHSWGQMARYCCVVVVVLVVVLVSDVVVL